MTPDEWWKNFALGLEVDTAGAFIYNGIRSLHELQALHHPVDTFEILYNLSVGIERLLKVAIILVEHDENIDIEAFEAGLVSHSTIDLANRVNSSRPLKLADVHREFLSLLSTFYRSHRYGRYSLSSVPDISKEKTLFLRFISTHLQISIPFDDERIYIPNTDQIRRFVGKIVKKICDEVFSVIQRKAHELNIYTDELRGDAKALRVFYGERLDFIDEDLAKKELILFLMNPSSRGPHIDLLRSFEALPLEPAMTANYIKALLNDAALPYVQGEVEELYTEVKNVKERLDFLGLMDNEYLSYGDDEEA